MTVQSIKYLSYKHKDPSSVSSTYIKMSDLVACPCNPKTGKAETGESLGLTGQPV